MAWIVASLFGALPYLTTGALGLVDIPLGTALGVYTFWVLIQDDAIEACKGRPEE